VTRFRFMPCGQDQVAGPTGIAEAIHVWIKPHYKRLLGTLTDAIAAALRTGWADASIILRPQHVLVAFRLDVDSETANLRAPAAGYASRKPVDPVFAYRIAIAIRDRTDFSFDYLLWPVAMPRLGLNLFLNLNFCNSCRHAPTCAKKEQV